MGTILVTGGGGFIGSNFIIRILERYPSTRVVCLDKMTYAADIGNLDPVIKMVDNFELVVGDICDSKLVSRILYDNHISSIVHFAAESHVDNSISSPDVFIQTNIVGTFTLLQESLRYFMDLSSNTQNNFRFLHISTDEVYGTLQFESKEIFNEDSRYMPNSPYSASKASSDLIARSYYQTYGLPVIITNCSNNFGPRQHIEKLIPKTILSCMRRDPIVVYGDGKNVRDWIYVDDHIDALDNILQNGKLGDTYCIGGDCEIENIDVVLQICSIFDAMRPCKVGKYSDLITFVKDRKGHDLRYAIDSSKIKNTLSFHHHYSFKDAIERTIRWYFDKSE